MWLIARFACMVATSLATILARAAALAVLTDIRLVRVLGCKAF